jgi:hypothetical protein
MPLRVLVLGEGKSEEGDGFYQPDQPGKAIPEEFLGAAHVLVRRVLVELLNEPSPEFVFPPRLRPARRTGNPGLINDLRGMPRPLTRGQRRPLGWLEMCVGNARVDLVVLLKDCKIGDCACDVKDVVKELQLAVSDRLPPIRPTVVNASAKPCLEAWLLAHSESSTLSEKQAKELWKDLGYRSGDVSSMAGVAWSLDLAKLEAVCPEGFGRLVKDLREALRACKAPSNP